MVDDEARAVEAVILDYGGVISTTPFAGIGEFEQTNGYPKGSLVRLLFGADRRVAGDPDQDAAAEAWRAYDAVDRGDPGAGDVADWHLLETGRIGLEEFHRRLVARAPGVIGVPVDGEFYGRFLSTLAVGVHWMVIHRVGELRAEGYRTAILTNNIREWADVWRSTIPMELFDVVVDSSEVGLRKPDPAIFRLTCERLGVAPEAAVFLDDSPRHVESARRLGLHAIVVADPVEALAELDALLAARRR